MNEFDVSSAVPVSGAFDISNAVPYTPEVQAVEKAEKRGFGEQMKFFLGEAVAKPLVRGAVSNIPASVVGVFRVGLDQFRNTFATQLQRDRAVFGISEKEFANRTPEQTKRIADNNRIYSNLGKIDERAKKLQDNFKDIANADILSADYDTFRGSFMENPSWTRAVALGIESVPILGLAAAITVATKNPVFGAGVIGSFEAAEEYEISREKLRPEQARGFFAMNLVALTALETVPLTGFMKGGALPVRMFRGGVQEGGEEVLQGVWRNSVAKIGYDETRELTEGLVEGLIAGSLSGGTIGAFSSSKAIRTQELFSKAKENGVDVEAMTEAVAEQVINNADAITEKVMEGGVKITDIAKQEPKVSVNVTPEMEGAVDSGLPVIEVKPFRPEDFATAEEYVASEVKRWNDGFWKVKPDAKVVNIPIGEIGKSINIRQGKTTDKGVQEWINRIKNGERPTVLVGMRENLSKGEVGNRPLELTVLDGNHRLEAYRSLGITEIPVLDNTPKSQLTAEWEAAKGGTPPPPEKPTAVSPGEPSQPKKSLQEKLSDIRERLKSPVAIAKADIKAIQSEVVTFIKEQDIPAKDKAKFLSAVKNANSMRTIDNVLANIASRAQVYAEAQSKRDVSSSIKKELEYTKPTKQGTKTVGKYDYESNKVFNEIRDISNLTQAKAQAMLDAMPQEGLSDIDIIKARLLSYKANGMDGSLYLHQQVLADIKRLKQLGSLAKNEEDFMKSIERGERAKKVLSGMEKVKGDAKSFETKVVNVYRKGFSNIYSMLNSIAGKGVAETLDPEPAENKRQIAISKKTTEIEKRVAEIFGIDRNAVIDRLQKMASEKFDITDVRGLGREISKLDVLDIYNSVKNDLVRERYDNAYEQTQIDDILSNLSPNEIALADYMQEVVQSYREVLNERHIEITGRDLGFVENYWPATSEHKQSVFDDVRVQGETPSSLKERTKSSKVIPIPKNAWLKMMKHISEGEHITHLSREYENLRRIFTDPYVKNKIETKFGEDIYQQMLKQIDNISLNKASEQMDFISDVFSRMLNNWVTAKIALNPTVYAKQLISALNYSENMPVGTWSAGFFEGIANPKKTLDFMWNNSGGFLEERYNKGYSEAIREAIRGANMISGAKRSWTTGLSAFVRSGDITAIIYGGYPYVKYQMSLGKSQDEAFDMFRKATLKSQQSGLSSGLSEWQNNRNPLVRMYLAFKNTANQYLRKQVDAIVSYRNNDITASKLAKITAIYSIINPLLFTSVGIAMSEGMKGIGRELFGADDDDDELTEEDLFAKLLVGMVSNPFQAIPILDDLSQSAAMMLADQPVYKVFSTPVLDDLETALRKLTKEDIELMDYFDSFGVLGEIATGAPIKTGLRIGKYLGLNIE